MPEHTIVAVYDTAVHADDAVRSLEAANVPSNAISRHASTTTSTTTAPAPAHEKGFWASLFGGDTDDADVYSRSVGGGSIVVTVKVPAEHVDRVSQILDQHNPVDLDERAATYGAGQATTTSTSAAATTAASSTPVAPVAARPTMPAAPQTVSSGDDTIKVYEESLSVGKRAVSKGGTRVRSYVVETPVEVQVTLREETVHVERRPVVDGRPATAADFQERVIELTETDEVAVVGKTARVVEEISVHKDVSEHVETVRDTVRKTQVDIEDTTGATRPAGTSGVSGSLGTSAANPPGTAVSRAVDKTLGTNISGANPTGKR